MKRYIYIAVIYCLVFCASAYSQSNTEIDSTHLYRFEISDVSLERDGGLRVISVTKNAQKITEAPAIISVITEAQIRNRGYRNLAEALSSVAGIDILDDRMQYNAGMRGINGGMRAWSRIFKVMLNNQPISFRAGTENFLGDEQIPIEIVERIEVIRGPNSALYGANAFLGVVNIITKQGEKINGGLVKSEVGSSAGNPAWSQTFAFGKKITNFNLLGAIRRGYFDISGANLKNMPSRQVYNATIRSENEISTPLGAYLKSQYTHKKLGDFSLDFHYQRLESYGEFQDWVVLTHKNRISLFNTYLRFYHQKKLNKKLSSHLSIAYTQGNPTQREKLAINQVRLADYITRGIGHKGIDVMAELDYELADALTLKAGIDNSSDDQRLPVFYRHFKDRPAEATRDVQGSKMFVNTGFYLQSIFYPLNFFDVKTTKQKFGITANLRYDVHNIYGNVLNYRLAGVYNPSDKWYFKILYGTSFKAPAPVQLYSTSLVNRDVVGNPNLRPEKARTAEIATGFHFLRGLLFEINGFYSQINDLVFLVRQNQTNSGNNIIANNLGKINSWGFESQLNYVNSNFDAYCNASFQRSLFQRRDFFRGSLTLNTRLYPQFMLKAGCNYQRNGVNINAEAQYIGKRIASEQNIYSNDPVNSLAYKLDDYVVVNMCLSTENFTLIPNKTTLTSLKINNLLGAEFYFPGYRDFDIRNRGTMVMLAITQSF